MTVVSSACASPCGAAAKPSARPAPSAALTTTRAMVRFMCSSNQIGIAVAERPDVDDTTRSATRWSAKIQAPHYDSCLGLPSDRGLAATQEVSPPRDAYGPGVTGPRL